MHSLFIISDAVRNWFNERAQTLGNNGRRRCFAHAVSDRERFKRWFFIDIVLSIY